MAEVGERGVAIFEAGPGGNTTRGIFGPDLSGVIDLLAHRKTTHGNFDRTADVAQKIKAIWRDTPNYEKLGAPQREAIDLIATKIARILCGNPRCKDHWADLAGYAKLAADDL